MKLRCMVPILFILLVLPACAVHDLSSPAEDNFAAPTMSNSMSTAVLPTLTPELASQPEPSSEVSTPHFGYPPPQIFPTAYPEPATPAPPTETPVPLPVVATLPLTATWFYDIAEPTAGCGYTLYARSPNGDMVEFDQSTAATMRRPNTTPLLFTCTPVAGSNGQLEFRMVDITQGTSIPLQLNTADNIYGFSNVLASPDGRYLIFGGFPRIWDFANPESFRGMYRADISTGEVVEMIKYTSDPEKAYDEAGVVWDLHTPISWDETGLSVHTTSSGDNRLWHFTWEEDAPLPYSVAAGTLTVTLLDSEISWPADNSIPYNEPSLPSHLTRPILIYSPPP
jgi:hypothetical protein